MAKKVVKAAASKAAKENKEFDLNEVHEAAKKRHANMEDKKKRDTKFHLQKYYEIDVKKSYEASLPLCENDPVAIAHLESVLASGNHSKE